LSVRGQVCGVQRPLLCCRSTGLYARRLPSLGRVPASPVPRRHQYYGGATTSRSRTPGSLWIRSQAPRVPPFVRARRSAPSERGGRSAGLGVWSAGVPLSGVLHPWARAGHHRFPGDPSSALALLQDPGRADKTSPLTASSILPPGTEHRRPQRIIISRLTQGFSIRCLRFKSGVAAAPARLASGWRAAPLPGGSRTLWTAPKGFRLHRHPPFQDFACRNQLEFRVRHLCFPFEPGPANGQVAPAVVRGQVT
jgi:hypothetical protein